jgi:hypothetical protein
MHVETLRFTPPRTGWRRWLLVGRAFDERHRLRGLSFCWVRGGWAFWFVSGRNRRG